MSKVFAMAVTACLLTLVAMRVATAGILGCGDLKDKEVCPGCVFLNPGCTCALNGQNAGYCVDPLNGAYPSVQVQCGIAIWTWNPNDDGLLVETDEAKVLCIKDRWCSRQNENACSPVLNPCAWTNWNENLDFPLIAVNPCVPNH